VNGGNSRIEQNDQEKYRRQHGTACAKIYPQVVDVLGKRLDDVGFGKEMSGLERKRRNCNAPVTMPAKTAIKTRTRVYKLHSKALQPPDT
jgi:hypothetical protein